MMLPDVSNPEWLSNREKSWLKFRSSIKNDLNRKELFAIERIYFGECELDYGKPDDISALERNWIYSASPFQTKELWEKRVKLAAFDVNEHGRRIRLERCSFEDRVYMATDQHITHVRPLLAGYDFKFGWDFTTQQEALLEYYLQGEKTYRPTLIRFNDYYALSPWDGWSAHEAFFSLLSNWYGWLKGSGGAYCPSLDLLPYWRSTFSYINPLFFDTTYYYQQMSSNQNSLRRILRFLAKREINWSTIVEQRQESVDENFDTMDDLGERQKVVEQLYSCLEEFELPDVMQEWWDESKADPDSPLVLPDTIDLDNDPTVDDEFWKSNLLREQEIAMENDIPVLTLEEAEKEWNTQ